MLINFSFENWKSFRNKTDFSMVAGRESQHKERLAGLPNVSKPKILPISAVYGGNASGKSNFITAIEFCKNMVCNNRNPKQLIPVSPFQLSSGNAETPSRFYLNILGRNDSIYEYRFTVTREKVLDESLVLCDLKKNEKDVCLYSRKEDKMEFHNQLSALYSNERLNFVFQGTQDNQLFLANAISQKVDVHHFTTVYRWFAEDLMILTPDSKSRFYPSKTKKGRQICSILSQLDTGIVDFGETETSLEELRFPDGVLEMIRNELQVKRVPSLHVGPNLSFRLDNNELKATLLEPVHQDEGGNHMKFSFEDESDGTLRIVDLLPMFIDIASSDSRSVFIVDEIDRSLHTHMIESLVKAFLASCTDQKRSQMVFTTHNVMLMDQDIFRRDEIWVTERQKGGESRLYSFAEFKEVRNDKKIAKSYLLGRMGGMPAISFSGFSEY